MATMELAGLHTNMSQSDDDGKMTVREHDYQETHTDIYIAVSMIGVLSVCGIFGNGLVIYVFSKQKPKLSSTIFIITLAVTDFLASLVTMPFTIVVELLFFKIENDFVCMLYTFTKTSVIPFSAMVMAAIAVDRYLIIVHPLKNLMTTDRARKAKIIVLILSFLAVVVGVINSLTQGVYERIDDTTMLNNMTESGVKFTDRGPDGFDIRNSSNAHNKQRIDHTSTIMNITWYGVNFANAVKDSFGIWNKDRDKHSASLQNGELYHHGFCYASFVIVSATFLNVYQNIYCGVYGICAVLVTILYAMIYKAIINQRSKRSQLGSFNTTIVSEENTRKAELADKKKSSMDFCDSTDLMDQQTSANGKQPENTVSTHKQDLVKRQREMKIRDANIKTALMLFIVAFIYIVAFTPAWLMALGVIESNVIIYYLYFVYNVANPVIYAFLNKDFRSHLRRLFTGRTNI